MSERSRYLDEALLAYSASDVYPFHMPGHKRRGLGGAVPEQIDITEIDGFDNLHHAEGILKEGQERLAALAGSDRSFYLVNGSTAGLLAAICASVRKGDRILIARNCHKAVYHAAYLMELRLEYVYPEPTSFGIQGSILPEKVAQKLQEYPDIAAVVITSPTYDGVVSDIAAIAQIVHQSDKVLIVDEAHGAHFGFSNAFPKKAVALGADLCIESLHKTLPAYTQTAALHLMRTRPAPDGKEEMDYRVDPGRVQRYLGIYQSSSPSYVLMAGIDRCVRIVQQARKLYEDPATQRQSQLAYFEKMLREFYLRCESLRNVQVFPDLEQDSDNRMSGIWKKDPSKILISAERVGLHGQALYDLLLQKYHLQMEMAAGHYVTAITTMMDTEAGFDRLWAALRQIDGMSANPNDSAVQSTASEGARIAECSNACETTEDLSPICLYRPMEKQMELAEAMDADGEKICLADAAGLISCEYIYLYPPGIPLIVPGEVITEDVLRRIKECAARGMQVQGLANPKEIYYTKRYGF